MNLVLEANCSQWFDVPVFKNMLAPAHKSSAFPKKQYPDLSNVTSIVLLAKENLKGTLEITNQQTSFMHKLSLICEKHPSYFDKKYALWPLQTKSSLGHVSEWIRDQRQNWFKSFILNP